MDQHTAIDAVPHGGQQERGRTHHRRRIIGRDFIRVSMGFFPRVFDLAVLAARGVGDRLFHRLGCQHVVDQQSPGRQIGADHRLADPVEVGAQHARQFAHDAFRRQILGDHVAHAHRHRELDQRVAAVEHDRQQPAEAADQRPVFRKQHREPAVVPVRRAAHEDRYRHQLHVQRRIDAMRFQQPCQRFGMASRRARHLQRFAGGDIDRHVGGLAQRAAGVAPRQRDVGAFAFERIAGQCPQPGRQIGFVAGAIQNQRIRQPVIFQYVTDRARVVGQGLGQRFDPQFDPRLQHPAQQARPPRPTAAR